MERSLDNLTGQVKKEKRLQLSRGMKYAGAGFAASALLVLGISFYMNEKFTDSKDAMACNPMPE